MNDIVIENDINSFLDAVLFKLRRRICETGDPSNAYGEAIYIIQQTFDEVFPAPIDGVPKEKLDESEDLYRYFMKKNFGIDESEE